MRTRSEPVRPATYKNSDAGRVPAAGDELGVQRGHPRGQAAGAGGSVRHHIAPLGSQGAAAGAGEAGRCGPAGAAQRPADVVPQRPGDRGAEGGPLGVGAVGAALHSLGGLPQRLAPPARDLHQAAQDRCGGVAGVHQLPDTAPALAGALLEQPDAVVVAAAALVRVVPTARHRRVGQHQQRGLLPPGHDRYRRGLLRQPQGLGRGDDEG